MLIQGGRALLGCQTSFAGLGWLLGGADQLLSRLAPIKHVPSVRPALAEVFNGTEGRPDRPTRQAYLAGASI